MKNVKAYNLGQIKEADIELGDFTVFVGPQASGKSILLQMMKLANEKKEIETQLREYGYNWDGSFQTLLELYLGEGMGNILNSESKLLVDDQYFLKNKENQLQISAEGCFYIPALRGLTISKSWPRNFDSFDILDPYVLKDFSEEIRSFIEITELASNGKEIFRHYEKRIEPKFLEKVNENIFYDAKVELDKQTPKKRIMLRVGNDNLPYLAWSSGQREFMPLLLAVYMLSPGKDANKEKLEDFQYVIIEEPEMGLHPKAIQSFLLLFLELMNRGYKVILSTHSPVILEFSWAIRTLKEINATPENLCDLFELKNSNNDSNIKTIFETILKDKTFKTYYFNRESEGVITQDISSLDPGTDDDNIADWGGITSFSTRVSEIISNLMAKQYDL